MLTRDLIQKRVLAFDGGADIDALTDDVVQDINEHIIDLKWGEVDAVVYALEAADILDPADTAQFIEYWQGAR